MSPRRLEPDEKTRAVAIDAFIEAEPRIPAMTLAEIDRRLTAALTAVAEDLRERAGLTEPPAKPSPKRRPKRS